MDDPTSAEPSGALAGLRVLDLTQVMSGPYCTMILADLGADVIKVESPAGGDQTRRSWGIAVKGTDSRAFLALNRNKRSVTLDLKSADGLRRFHRLAATADIVIENFRPGVAKRLRIDYPELSRDHPELIYASISGFGQTGPYASRPGYDLIVQAMTGVMSITGEPGGEPVKSGLPVADLGAGLFAAIGVLAAVTDRHRTGKGQYLETSLYEAALAMSVWESTEFWATGEAPAALGSANRMSAPYQALPTSDGYVTIGANNEKLWAGLCRVIDRTDLITDPRFADNTRRMAHRAALIEILSERFRTRSTDAWVDALLAAGVPAGPIRNYSDVLDHDQHVRDRGMISTVDHPVEGPIRVLGTPLKLDRTPAGVWRPPPLLGEHNDEILAELSESDPDGEGPR